MSFNLSLQSWHKIWTTILQHLVKVKITCTFLLMLQSTLLRIIHLISFVFLGIHHYSCKLDLSIFARIVRLPMANRLLPTASYGTLVNIVILIITLGESSFTCYSRYCTQQKQITSRVVLLTDKNCPLTMSVVKRVIYYPKLLIFGCLKAITAILPQCNMFKKEYANLNVILLNLKQIYHRIPHCATDWHERCATTQPP